MAFELQLRPLSTPLLPPARALALLRLAGLAGLAGLGAGCLYTNPINMPPAISIRSPPHVWHNQPAVFSATASDPDGDLPAVSFADAPGDCTQAVPQQPLRTPLDDRGAAYTVAASRTAGPFCVWAFATDGHGATTSASLLVQPEDHPPVADLQIVGPLRIAGEYPLYEEMEFSAAGSSDVDPGDTLTYGWKLVSLQPTTTSPSAPSPSNIAFTPCSDHSDLAAGVTRCFIPSVPGDYRVDLEVSSAASATASAAAVQQSQTFTVAQDRLPCITMTDPDIDQSLTISPLTQQMFQVLQVSDDGDPWPRSSVTGQATQFSWFVGQGTEPVVYQDNAGSPAFLILPFQYRSGDEIRVRVEIHDRNVATIDRILAACGSEEAICPPASICYQRKTWVVRFL